MPFSILAASLPFQVSTNALGKAETTGPNHLGPATNVGDLEEAAGSGLQRPPSLAEVAAWRELREPEDERSTDGTLSLCICPSLSLFQTKNLQNKKSL